MANPSLEVRGLVQRWQRLSRRQQVILLIIGSTAVVWTMDTLALRPLRRHVRALHQQLRDTTQRLSEAVVAGDQAKAVNRAYTAYEPYLTTSGSSEADLAAVLSEVEAGVREAGMTLFNLKPASSRPGTEGILSVSVDGEASPSQLARLLDLVQRSPHLLKVTELTIRVSEGKTLRTSFVISKLVLQ